MYNGRMHVVLFFIPVRLSHVPDPPLPGDLFEEVIPKPYNELLPINNIFRDDVL